MHPLPVTVTAEHIAVRVIPYPATGHYISFLQSTVRNVIECRAHTFKISRAIQDNLLM